MKKPHQPGSAVSSVRSLSSRDGQASVDSNSISSPSLSAAREAPLDERVASQPSRLRGQLQITVMGDSGVGKSELVRKYLYGFTHFRFSPGDRISGTKTVKVNNGDDYVLTINDTFSVHMDTPIAVHQINQADGVMLVYSIDQPDSLQTVINVFNFIALNFKDNKGKKTMPVCIVANKCDLGGVDGNHTNAQRGAAFAKERGCPFFQTSAANEQGIHDSFKGLSERILIHRAEKASSDDVFSKLKRKLQGK